MTTLTQKLTTVIEALLTTEGISLGEGDTLLDYLRALASIEWAGALEDIILALETIAAAARVTLELNSGSATPDLSAVSGCTVVGSNNNAVVEADGRTYVQWNEIPPNTHTVDPSGLIFAQELHADNPPYFQGTKIVVQSSQPYFKMNATDVAVYRSGEVITLTSDEDIPLLPSIEGEGFIKLYVCVDLLAEIDFPLDWDSTYEDIIGYSSRNQINWGDYGSVIAPSGSTYSSAPVMLYGNFKDWGFRQSGGGGEAGFRVAYWTDATTFYNFGVSLGVTNTIPVDTICVLVDDVGNDAPFHLTMVPPA